MGITKSNLALVAILSLLVLLVAAACKGDEGVQGPQGLQGVQGIQGVAGPAGASTGTLAGTVTNSLTKAGVAGVDLAIDPAIAGVTIQSDSSGKYSATLPIGSYAITLKKTGYGSGSANASVLAGQTTTKDVALKPTAAVVVNAGADQTKAPAGSATLKVTVDPMDGSSVTGYKWSQTAGVKATVTGDTTAELSVTLADAAAYKAELIALLPVHERFQVQAINPLALEEAEIATFKVTVTTATGSYSDTVNVVASLPYVVNTGLANVPVGLPVLLNGKTQTAYAWTITGPTGSTATLSDASTANPSFTPNVVGKYTLAESNSKATIDVYAGTWAGAISGQDAKGEPLSANCTGCHSGTVAPDKFTAWKSSGHAEIFTQNIDNPSGHWSASCAACHTVGYSLDVTNNGFDEAMAAEKWVVPSHGDVGTWTSMLANYPKTAQLANIQCENCHGPNNGSTLHMNGTIDTARVSMAADVCGACHGEPPRHGRFQQWEESLHADIELASEESGSASCIRCHSGQGFLLWLKQGDLTKSILGKDGKTNATTAEIAAMGITPDTAQPQTCATCHDPHALGSVTGEANDVILRVQGDTAMLPGGFKAVNVGNGALCITCHNTRNAAHNDSIAVTGFGGPHQAAQGDMLMGENAYFVVPSQRSPHSYIENTCTYCHMIASPPPAEFSYQQSGTNHSFEASTEICSECHSDKLNPEALQAGFTVKADLLKQKMASYFLSKLPATMTVRDYNTSHTYGGKTYAIASDYLVVNKDNIASVEWAYITRQSGFKVTFKTPVTFTYKPANETPHTVAMTTVAVRLGELTTDGKTLVIPLTDPLAKASWNYLMMTYDGSKGIHNPPFVNAVIDASIQALK